MKQRDGVIDSRIFWLFSYFIPPKQNWHWRRIRRCTCMHTYTRGYFITN